MGKNGLNTDIAPWDLDMSFVTSGVNFRVYANYIETAGGYEIWGTAPSAFHPGHIMFAGDSDNRSWLIAGREGIYSFDSTTWNDVTNPEFITLPDDTELDWTSCMLGQIPILNNFQAYPVYWSPPVGAQVLTQLPFDAAQSWEDVNMRAKVIRSHKNYLFALYIQEGATEYPNVYRWSHPADINGLPFTWDETDPSSLAGRASIGGDFGPIVDGLTLRDSFVIYSESGINALNESGDEFIWARRALSSSVGLISKNCLIEVRGTHLLIADGDILANDGSNIRSLINNRLQRQFAARLNPEYFFRSFAVRNDADREVWFCVPSEDAEYPNLAYIYNWKEDSWAIRDLPSELTFAAYGPKGTPLLTWDNWQGSWDEQRIPWGSPKKAPFDGGVVGVRLSSEAVILDPTGPRENGSDLTILERTDIPVDGQEQVTTIVEVYPKIAGASPVILEFGSQKVPGGPVSWKPPQQFTPGVDRKLNVRTTGSLHCWRISSPIEANWQFSGMDFIYEHSGKR